MLGPGGGRPAAHAAALPAPVTSPAASALVARAAALKRMQCQCMQPRRRCRCVNQALAIEQWGQRAAAPRHSHSSSVVSAPHSRPDSRLRRPPARSRGGVATAASNWRSQAS